MSWTHKQRLTVIALVVLVATAPVLWQIASVRTAQATDSQQAELTNETITERQTPDDYDGDGIPDSTDRCPTRPETENGFEDADGCPDIVETTGAS
jgi:hypothetical protein